MAEPKHGLVEAVDIVPTLLELAGIQIPPFLQGAKFAGRWSNADRTGGGSPLALTEGNGWKALRTDQIPLSRSRGRAGDACGTWTQIPGEYFDVAGKWRDMRNALADCRKTLLRRLLEMERPLPRAWTY